MRASGNKDSFELLLARIIAQLTGEEVCVAKSGPQWGDAMNSSATIAIQAKRYQDSTPLNLNEFEGELRGIARRVPQMEVCVLATTRSAQDIPRLSEIGADTGVSIVTVDWHHPDRSTLGRLCAVCWEAIRDLKPFDTLSDEWTDWMREEADRPEIIQAVKDVQRELLEEAALHSQVASVSRQRLEKQFFQTACEKQPRSQFNQIELSQAIPRESIMQLEDWWNEGGSSPPAIVRGQEGTGKSWVTAAFAHRISATPENAVLWLESRDWSTCRSMRALLEQALRDVVNERSLSRVVFKAIHKWQKPVLIVLDGVNERDAVGCAKDILRDWQRIATREDRPASHIRLLFTSRERAADELCAEHSNLRLITVGPYSDEEMSQVLPMLKADLTLMEIPTPLLERVARIPRYLPTCIRLLPELGGLQQITVELVLWHDLLLRLREDVQVRKHLGIEDSGDVESILSRLARECTAEGDISVKQLAEVFDASFKSIRHDLRELRWLSEARLGRETARISPDHVRLGWALYLREVLRGERGRPADIEDRLQAAMEPISAEDHRIAALRVCGRLSLTDSSGFGGDLPNKREALLRLWIKSRNISQMNDELSFWFERDDGFYLGVVERLLPEFVRSDLRERLVIPLVLAWKSEPSEVLIAVMTRWIHLIAGSPERWRELEWPAHSDGDEVVIGGHRFPRVADEDLLCLTGAAMTILSHRADQRMLRPLALALGTESYSSRYHPPPQQAIVREGSSAKGLWIPNKTMIELCGPIMRWVYGEEALPQLQKLVDENPADGVLKHGARWMVAFLELMSVPLQLQLPSDCSYRQRLGPDPVEDLLRGRQLLQPGDDEGVCNRIQWLGHFDPLGTLASWEEVDWHPGDKTIIQEVTPRFLGTEQFRHSSGGDICFAWLARWNPRAAAACAARAICAFRFSENSIQPDHFAIHVLPHSEERAEVLECLRTLLENAPGDSYGTIASWPGQYIALLLKQDEWQDWIQWLEKKPSVRLSMNFQPVGELLRARLPLEVVAWLHERLLEVDFTPETTGENGATTFLAHLASSKKLPNAQLFERVKVWLKLNRQERSMYTMFRLWIAIAPDFASLLRESALLSLSFHFRHFIQHNWSRLIAEGEVFAADTPYESLVHHAPWDELGRFLLRHERLDDFKRWGGDLLEAAKASFADSKRVPLPTGGHQRRLDASGRVESIGPPSSVFPSMTFVSASTAWLAERRELTPGDSLRSAEGLNIEEVNRRNEAWREWFRDGSNDPTHQSRHWLFFSAGDEIMEWAARHHDEFRTKAVPFLKEYGCLDPNHCDDDDNLLSGMVRNFADAWLRLCPSDALAYFRKVSFSRVTEMQYGFAKSYQQIWNPRITVLPELAGRPREALSEATNDLEIARLTLAAQVVGAGQTVFRMAQEWTESKHMSERALAISILAWIETPDALDILENLQRGDASRWVRQHAMWATCAWKTEDYAKRLFWRISEQTEIWLASVMLEQLHPALTFAAKYWMARDLNSIRIDTKTTGDIRGLLSVAYFRRSSRSGGNDEKIWGRDLTRHWRGEQVNSHAESLAPHWQVR